MESKIKFKRTISGLPVDYGKKFTKELNKIVGGKQNWRNDEWSHGIATTPDNELRIKKCEDGPDFYLNVANTFAAYASLLVSLISLWISMPKKEREIGGKRYIEVSHPGITVRVECTDIKLAESRLKKVLKALV